MRKPTLSWRTWWWSGVGVAVALVVLAADRRHSTDPVADRSTEGAAATSVSPARRGVVRLDRHVFVDDDGPYLGLGASLFWGGWGCLHDRERLDRNLKFLAGKVDYIRALGVVGPKGWRDRATPAADLEAAVTCLTDLAYDTYGLRVKWTIFGGVETTPTPEDREALTRRFAVVAAPRAQKIQLIELANEAWQNGFGGDAGRTEARRLAQILRDTTPNIIALTSPQAGAESSDITRWYAGSPATLVTIHPDRSQVGPGGAWRPVRQVCDVQFWTALPWEAGEPIGPQSSVASDDDPLRLTMTAAYTWLCGGAGYVLHSGAGVRGGGIEDRARGRVANLGDVPRIEQTLAGINAVRRLLPPDLPNWTRHNSTPNFPNYPFALQPIAPHIEAGRLLRAFAATAADGRVVAMPIVVTAPVAFAPSTPLHVDVYDPLTGARLESYDGPFSLSPRLAAVLIGRRP